MVTTKILGVGNCGCNIVKKFDDAILWNKEKVDFKLDADVNIICAGLGNEDNMDRLRSLKLDKNLINIAFLVLPFEIENNRFYLGNQFLYGNDMFTSIALFDNELALSNSELAIEMCKSKDFDDNYIGFNDNDNLSRINKLKTIKKTKAKVNNMVQNAIKSFIGSFEVPTLVALDYSDIKEIATNSCVVEFSHYIDGKINRDSISMGWDVNKAKGVLVNIEANDEINLDQINQIGELISKELKDSTEVIWTAKVTPKKVKTKLSVFYFGV